MLRWHGISFCPHLSSSVVAPTCTRSTWSVKFLPSNSHLCEDNSYALVIVTSFLQRIDKCKRGINRFYITPVQRMRNLGGHFLTCFSEQRKGLHKFLRGAWSLAQFPNPSTINDVQWAVLSSVPPCPFLRALEEEAASVLHGVAALPLHKPRAQQCCSPQVTTDLLCSCSSHIPTHTNTVAPALLGRHRVPLNPILLWSGLSLLIHDGSVNLPKELS